MKGHTDKKTYRRSGRTETRHFYRCNRYKVRVGEQTECKNQSLIYCHQIDEPLLLHIQHTLDRVVEIKEAFNKAVRNGHPQPSRDLERRLAEEESRRDRVVDAIADGTTTKEEARRKLTEVRQRIEELQAKKSHQEAPPQQLGVLDEFEGINLAEYSLEEKRELLSIVVKEIKLRFDRLFITYNLYEEPGKLYVGEVKVQRNPTHNSKLKKR